MKKILLFLLIISFVKKDFAQTYNNVPLSKSPPAEKTVKLTKIQKISAILNFVNEHIDYMLTTKGAVKTIIILSPFFMVYCYYFKSDPIQALINKIIQSIGKAEEVYKIQKEIGKSKIVLESFKNEPSSMFLVVANKILDKTIYIGLPFLAGICVKAYFGV